MSLGDEWTSAVSGSAAKLNGMTVTYGTGSYLSSLDYSKHKLLVCTADGSGFTLDHLYLCTTDGTSVIDVSSVVPHTHVNDSTGGNLTNIFVANPRFTVLQLTKPSDLYEASWASPVFWVKTVSGTGSVENKTDGTTGERSIRLRPNGTSGSGSTIQYPHLINGFGSISIFQTKLQIETATSIALHVGVNADTVTAADSNTVKYQVEVCTATNNNWWLRTADGSATSASDTGIAISANRVGIAIVHNPGEPEADIYIDSNTVFQKTTNIPVTGETADNNITKISVKNSTGADRPLLYYGSRLTYKISTNEDWANF